MRKLLGALLLAFVLSLVGSSATMAQNPNALPTLAQKDDDTDKDKDAKRKRHHKHKKHHHRRHHKHEDKDKDKDEKKDDQK
jgi:hypothetical protein